MKYFKIVLILFLFAEIKLSAQHVDLRVKEDYDWHHIDHYSGNGVGMYSDAYGDDFAVVMESEIKMFETTGDKAYLIKCINFAVAIMERRHDYNSNAADQWPRWAYDDQIYQDGLICRAMSHLVYLIQVKHPELGLLTISQQSINTFPATKLSSSANIFGIDFYLNTYNYFSNWLRENVRTTLDYFINGAPDPYNFWTDDAKCFQPYIGNDQRALQINQQAGLATALFYMGSLPSHPRSDYVTKYQIMAQKFFGQFTRELQGSVTNCPGSGEEYIDVFEIPHFELDAYAWHDNGWRTIICQENDGSYDYEDVAHGTWTMAFPLALYHNLGPTNGLFDQQWMTRVRNTVTNNLYWQYNGTLPVFHADVSGNDVTAYNADLSVGGSAYHPETVLGYMPFYQFDSYSLYTPYGHSVYDLIFDYYRYHYNTTTNVTSAFTPFSSIPLEGIAEITAAQWDKECTNLTLYNRDLNYDQDFFAKNILTIDPSFALNGNTSSFADPVIQDPRFTIYGTEVDNPVTSNITAGENIIFKAGFTAQMGCTMTAKIVPTNCTDGMRMANGGLSPSSIPDQSTLSPTKITMASSSFTGKIYPNPASKRLFIYGNNLQDAQFTITNTLGNIIINIMSIPTEGLDITSLADGTYFCSIIFSDGSIKKDKLIIIK